MCARTLNRQRLSNVRTLTPAASRKASSKAKPWGFLELTLQRRNLTNTSHYSNKDCNTGVIQITFWTGRYLKSISAKECRLYKTNKKRAVSYRIPPKNARSRPYSYEQMASYTKPALTTEHIQKLSPYFIWKSEVFERCTRQSKTRIGNSETSEWLWGLWISYPGQ